MELEELKLEKEKIVNLQNNYFDKLLNKINEYEKEVKNYKLILKNLENKVNELTLEIKLKDEEALENKRKITELRSELTKAEDEIYNLRAMNPYTKLELIKDLKEAYIKVSDDEAEEILDEILEEISIIEDKISEDDMMVIMYLSYIYDRLQVILGTSSMANNYYSSLNKEAKLLKIISQEENCKPYASMDECTQSYISKEKDLFNKLDIKLKKRIIETLYDMSYKTFNGVYKESDMELGDSTVNIKAWVKEENDLSWKLISGIYSHKNDRIYLPESMIKVLGVKLNKSQDDIDKELLSLNINEVKSNVNLEKVKKYEALYSSLLEYFIENNLGKSLLTFNNIVEDINALKHYNRMQKITLLFIGYLIKKSTFGATKIMNSGDIGVSSDTILYKKLSEGRDYIEYLTEYRDSLKLIDPKVKGEIIVKMISISKDDSKKHKTITVINQEEFEVGNLNAESEIKKMGYSTSLSRVERWNILKNKAVPKLGKAKVIGHIRFLIKMNKSRSIMFNAVSEWEYDLERLIKL